MSSPFTEDSAERKKFPVYSGFVDYFPDAMAAVARVSFDNNQKHNPGAMELNWNRDVSGDELDALMRHIIDGQWDQVAWRAMAHLQKQIERKQKSDDIVEHFYPAKKKHNKLALGGIQK